MQTRVATGLLLAAILVPGWGTAQEVTAIGFVKKVTPEAAIVRAGTRTEAVAGAEVRRGDRLLTGQDGSLGVTMKDGTLVSIGPDTEYELTEFAFRPREKELGFVSRIIRGTLHFVSGALSRLAPESVSVATPEGTIGIRGTRFVVKVEGR